MTNIRYALYLTFTLLPKDTYRALPSIIFAGLLPLCPSNHKLVEGRLYELPPLFSLPGPTESEYSYHSKTCLGSLSEKIRDFLGVFPNRGEGDLLNLETFVI